MTPTLFGRVQTRLLLLATVGVVWTMLVVPILPRSGMSIRTGHAVSMQALLVTAVVGSLLWEPIYHLAQQWRWEKDWPILFGLLQGILEGIVVYWLLERWRGSDVPGLMFLLHFLTTWVLAWLVSIGPLRVVLLRWRYRGGRII